jgi:hypothetical protein
VTAIARQLRPRRRAIAALGVVTSSFALALSVMQPQAVSGWLAAFVFWSGVPIGALCLVMMIRLIPGAWDEELAPAAESALALLPLAAAAILPILVALPVLYPWTGMAGMTGFRGVYLTQWFFITRSLTFFAVAGVLAVLLLTRRQWSTAIASVGLIAFVLLDTTVAVDWLMSRDPQFHSSGFGLYVLSIQVTIALATLVPLRVLLGYQEAQSGLLGALLLTTLLLWAYFAFMQYLISWSGNFPYNALWYQERGGGPWSLVEYAIGALGLVPAFLLLFPPVRQGPAWLVGLSVAVLFGKALEASWLALPVLSATPATTFAVTVLALCGLGAFGATVLSWALEVMPGSKGNRPECREASP